MKRVTLSQVAEHAGVSRATASLVMRGEGRISTETRERVQQSMQALGYVYHRGAAALRERRSGVIGLLVTQLSNPFHAAMAVQFEQTLAEAGYLTMLANTFDNPERERSLIRSMREMPVDALAHVPVSTLQREESQGLPAGYWPDLALTRQPQIETPWIGQNDIHGGALAAEHLSRVHGCRRLVYLGGPEGASVRTERVQGVNHAIKAAGGRLVADMTGHASVQGGLQLAEQWLDGDIATDGVICHSDIIAFALMAACRRRIGQIPWPIIGFDGLEESALYDPPLTTVTVGPEEVGALAAHRILAILDGQDVPSEQRLDPILAVRASCGCNLATGGKTKG
ncbi:LacI family DNA-binding transcriptional regulator [Modicisalibacter radicis]|uniref:LacI family DNA-binding transcriptional regulator n=1 Tax=Halomonas sp. EAR18 TaxID=2518972 RepID=UPI00109BF754|nr:LacI family DNA-binding transcriptional regulator [Halomonas sp. EAR18]